MIQTYYGYGKGKTTASVGAVIRFAGCKNKVLFAEFLKDDSSSEINILNSLEDVEVVCSDECYKLYDNLKCERTEALTNAYTNLLECIKNKADSAKMIVLDEILDAIEFGYVNEDDFIYWLNSIKNNCEIILTGHKLTEKISEISDYISEIKEIKHPYTKGSLPRKGIEF